MALTDDSPLIFLSFIQMTNSFFHLEFRKGKCFLTEQREKELPGNYFLFSCRVLSLSCLRSEKRSSTKLAFYDKITKILSDTGWDVSLSFVTKSGDPGALLQTFNCFWKEVRICLIIRKLVMKNRVLFYLNFLI